MNAGSGVIAAFAAGFLSFLSPCVLPLVPSYLAMLAGTSVTAVRTASAEGRGRIFGRALAFVLGFSAVFVGLGLVISGAAAMIGGASRTVSVIAGFAVILLGLNVAFDFLKILNLEARFHSGKRPAGSISAFFFGAAFAAGWSPCVGPMLASILFLAGSGSLGRAAVLLGVYSFGLALPFLAAGLFFGSLEGVLRFFKSHIREVKFASGGLLVLIGLSMLAGNFRALNGTLARWGYALDDLSGPGALIARVGFAALYGALAFAAAFRAIRVSASADGESMRVAGPRRATTRRSVARRALATCTAAALFALAILEASGLLVSARILAAWFLFQGV